MSSSSGLEPLQWSLRGASTAGLPRGGVMRVGGGVWCCSVRRLRSRQRQHRVPRESQRWGGGGVVGVMPLRPTAETEEGADQGCIFQEEDSAEDSAAVLAKVQEALEQAQRSPLLQEQQTAEAPGACAAWRLCKGSRRQVAAVLSEMKWWYAVNQKVTSGDVPLAEADTAESLKHWLLATAPAVEQTFAQLDHPASALWNRISLQRLRTYGKRDEFLVMHSRQRGHRLLVLKVPAGNLTGDQRWEHARRQASYQDDHWGNFSPGVRVQWEQWKPFLAGEDLAWVEQMQRGGQPMLMHERPAQYWRVKGNYGSYVEHREKGAAELQRLLDRGVLEGPLHYRPWIVNPMGGVWQAEKEKWRTIFDLTASGVNDCLLPLDCNYDTLDAMLPRQTPEAWQFGWDLKDAFFNTGRWEEHGDYMGLQDTETGEFYRFRYALFGGADCPAHQQRFSQMLTKVLDKAGETLGWGDTKNTAVFMDDGHGVQPKQLSKEEADRQYSAMMNFMNVLGVEDSVSKRVLPSKLKSYIGFAVDSDSQEVRPEPKKIAKYTEALAEMRRDYPEGVVPRKVWASVVGKLQHVAEVVQGGQQLLSAAYDARQNFVGEVPEERQWADTCLIQVPERAWGDLFEFVGLLADASRRYYLDGAPEENGFFKGVTLTSHEEMDETSRAHANIPVFTTDASGTAGGGHTGDRRFFMKFPEGDCAPCRSSNWREFTAGLEALKQFASTQGWSDQRVLWRTDNTTSMSICNRQGTMATELRGISTQLMQFCRSRGLEVGAAHISGVLNGLADRLSRHAWQFETGDWQIVEEAFQYAQHLAGVVFSLDGGADIVGSNSYLDRFRSVADSFLDHSVEGEHVYANPDFSLIAQYLDHFLEGQRRAPEKTSGTFVLPVWTWAPFWRRLRGAQVLAYIPQGEHLFTSPEWRTREGGAQPQGRASRGATRWGVVLIHFPPSVDRRYRDRAGEGHRGRPPDDGARGEQPQRQRGLRTLRGEAHMDEVLLRGLQTTTVRDMQRWWRASRVPAGEVHEVPREGAAGGRLPADAGAGHAEAGAGAGCAGAGEVGGESRHLQDHAPRPGGARGVRGPVPHAHAAADPDPGGALRGLVRSASREPARHGHGAAVRDLSDQQVARAGEGGHRTAAGEPHQDQDLQDSGEDAVEAAQEAIQGQGSVHGEAAVRGAAPRLRPRLRGGETRQAADDVPGSGTVPSRAGVQLSGEVPHRDGGEAAQGPVPAGLGGVHLPGARGGDRRRGEPGQERDRTVEEAGAHPPHLFWAARAAGAAGLPPNLPAPLGGNTVRCAQVLPQAHQQGGRQGGRVQRGSLHSDVSYGQAGGRARLPSAQGEPGLRGLLRGRYAAQVVGAVPLVHRDRQESHHRPRRVVAREGGRCGHVLPHPAPPEAGAPEGAPAGAQEVRRAASGHARGGARGPCAGASHRGGAAARVDARPPRARTCPHLGLRLRGRGGAVPRALGGDSAAAQQRCRHLREAARAGGAGAGKQHAKRGPRFWGLGQAGLKVSELARSGTTLRQQGDLLRA